MNLQKIIAEHALWLNSEGGERANLRNANLRNANLSDANLHGADLSGANLRYANLRNANLRNAALSEANLRNTNLFDADLSGANLSDANLRNANLRNANLSDANLHGADLSNAAYSAPIFRLDVGQWSISFNAPLLQIGCQCHHTDAWRGFSDDEITAMSPGALEFWRVYKEPLLLLADRITEAFPHKAGE